MAQERLRRLRKQAELIIPPLDQPEVHVLHKSLEQIERDLDKINIKPTQELLAKAHYFLASNGLHSDVYRPIDTSQTFEIVQQESRRDLVTFMKEEHETLLIDILEEQRSFTEFDAFFEMGIKEAKERELNQTGDNTNTMDYKDFEQSNTAMIAVRIVDYANVVIALNNNRLADTDYDLISNFAKLRNTLEPQSIQDIVCDAWNIVGHFVEKLDAASRLEGRFLKDFIASPYYSTEATNARRSLMNASKSWLEKESAQYMNNILNKNAIALKIGGIPSITHRSRAFIDLIFKTAAGWTDHRLEIVDGLPIWVFIYVLIRSGHLTTAAEFIGTHREMFVSERKFVPYFEEYIKDPYHCVSKTTQQAILADYCKFNYGDDIVDPYKLLIYKILGRCELHVKTCPEVIKTYEDYIWLQLMLVREFKDTETQSFERYRLEDLQKDISSQGSQHFDPEGKNPWIYFKILLLTNQFERAIDHLHKQKQLRIETVHFAIAFMYLGLLHIPKPDVSFYSALLLVDENKRPVLNIVRLLYQYVETYNQKNAKQAIHYLSTLTLYSSKQGYPTNVMMDKAKTYIYKFTMSSADFKLLLGNREKEHVTGYIESIQGLLGIQNDTEYAQQIIHPIAERCLNTGRCADSVYAYNLAADFNCTVDVLSKELSDALQQPLSCRVTDPTLSEKSNQDILRFATETMTYFEKNQHLSRHISDQRNYTVRILMQLLQFRIAYEAGELDQALQLIEQTRIIPFGGLNHAQQCAEQFKSLAETITKNIPELLLNVMDILYKIWSAYLPQVEQIHLVNHELTRLEEKARAVLTFTGLVEIYIPNDILFRLNKVDAIMSTRKR